ncbi:MAG: ATP-binding protein, partial [Bacilli bacterium]|nr:ATP-binding protein [Bacilli bacterium]
IMDAAKLVGVTIKFYGEQPKADRVNEKLLIAAMHECLTNTVLHANGQTMTVNVANKNGKYIIVITNDGEKPKYEIIEGGGLSGLRSLVERENGKMTIHSNPQFELIIELPQGEIL